MDAVGSNITRDRVIQELKPILKYPGQLHNLSTYIADFREQAKVVRSQLYSTYERNLSDLMSRYNTIPWAVDLVKEMHADFLSIVHTAKNCRLLFENDQLIKLTKISSHNMKTVDNLLSQLSAVPKKLRVIKKNLSQMEGNRIPRVDRRIKDTYLNLRSLVLLRNRIWKEGNQNSVEFKQNMKEQFEEINQVAERLERAVLDNIEDTLALCLDDPATLIRTLMVIEMEVCV